MGTFQEWLDRHRERRRNRRELRKERAARRRLSGDGGPEIGFLRPPPSVSGGPGKGPDPGGPPAGG
jgi:hypothetical protein